MPAAREQFRAEYEKICKDLVAQLIARGGLPLEALAVRDDILITIAAIGQLSHAILGGMAKPEQYNDWIALWRSLVEFEQTEQEAFA